MNDQEYIRKAVELADGFEYRAANDYYYINHEAICRGAPKRYFMNALAAQLARQAHALDNVSVTLYGTGLAEVVRFTDGEGEEILALCETVDRNMSIIRAIVDSKVLETET